MDKNSTFGALFEQGKTALDDSASNIVDTTKKQVAGSTPTAQNQPNLQNTELQAQLSEESREIIRDFYSPSDTAAQPQDLENGQEQLAKVRKELQTLAASLHQSNYYEPLFAYEKKKDKTQAQAAQNEEVAEEQEKMSELQKQEKKKVDLAKFKAQRSVEIKGDIIG